MEKWLDDNILMHSKYNKGKSVVAESFIKTLKFYKNTKIYKKFIANDSKSHIGYLNKLVYQ